jgi:hypothetical protein
MKVQVDQICDAIKSALPQEMGGDHRDAAGMEQRPQALDVGTDSFNDADDAPFDPTEFTDEDDQS